MNEQQVKERILAHLNWNEKTTREELRGLVASSLGIVDGGSGPTLFNRYQSHHGGDVENILLATTYLPLNHPINKEIPRQYWEFQEDISRLNFGKLSEINLKKKVDEIGNVSHNMARALYESYSDTITPERAESLRSASRNIVNYGDNFTVKELESLYNQVAISLHLVRISDYKECGFKFAKEIYNIGRNWKEDFKHFFSPLIINKLAPDYFDTALEFYIQAYQDLDGLNKDFCFESIAKNLKKTDNKINPNKIPQGKFREGLQKLLL